MYLHEYQAKKLLASYGVPVMPHQVVGSIAELEAHVRKNSLHEAVLKIQVHTGGRGKAGGIVLARSQEAILEKAKPLLGMRIVTNQTGPDGIVAEKLLIDTPVSIASEYYLAIILDRKEACASVIVSKEGGVEIEEVAKKTPEKMLVEKIPDCGKLRHFQLARLISFLELQAHEKEVMRIIQGSIQAFFENDAMLVEVNPLVLTKDNQLIALDAKVQIDDNALFRKPALEAMWDPHQLSIEEQEAHLHDLAYVALKGTIGCMVNGAGLAMATMDLIRVWGGEPANFLDVGGSATLDKVVEGFRILFKDKKVRAILVNIFGGIMNCEIIAEALLKAVREQKTTIPVVVRMEGTNVVRAKEMLKEANIAIFSVDTLDDAAKRVVEEANGHSRK